MSYARDDLKDESHLTSFLEDLERELQGALGQREPILLREMDHLRPGDEWREELAEAVGSCGMLLAVCSPHFVASEFCAREVSVFLQRLESLRTRGAAPARKLRPIVPLIWRDLARGEFPAVLTNWYFANAPQYVGDNKGLRHSCRFDQASRNAFITWFAGQLVSIMDDGLPPARSRYLLANQQPAWDARRPSQANGSGIGSPNGATAQSVRRQRRLKVHLRIAAGLIGEMEGVRTFTDPYGADSADWCPFEPETDEPIAADAKRAALDTKLDPVSASVDDDLPNHVLQDQSQPEITVVLADPWTLRLSNWAHRLTGLDRLHIGYGGLIIVWNANDAETIQRRQELIDAVTAVFPIKWDRPPPNHFFTQIETREQFREHLLNVLDDARNRIVARVDRPRLAKNVALALQAEAAGIDLDNRAVVQGPVGEVS